MSIAKLVFVLVIAGAAYHYWYQPKADVSRSTAPSRNGFVALPPLDNLSTAGVVIFAPENCPSDGAQRADGLAQALSRSGMPYTRATQANFTFSGQDQTMLDTVNAVMNGEVPIVFVRGRAKANPSMEEVVDEYRSGGG